MGKIINYFTEVPFALPILHDHQGKLTIDAALFGEEDLQIPVQLCPRLLHGGHGGAQRLCAVPAQPHAPQARAEIYNALGLAKQGKTLFYRDFLHHLKHSSDQFRIAPGIKGMVMLVFDLPSFPYVFKLIGTSIPRRRTPRASRSRPYMLVKQHDRVGRMADTPEYSEVAFPRDRFSDELIAEIEKFAPASSKSATAMATVRPEVIIKHLYIERRMIPLNIYLQEALDQADDAHARQQIERCVIEYGNAIRDMVAANIFPGDMLWKNFGITRTAGGVLRLRRDRIPHRLQLPPRARAPQRRRRAERRDLVHRGATRCVP